MEHANWSSSPCKEIVLYYPIIEEKKSIGNYNPFNKIIDDFNTERYKTAFANVQKNFEDQYQSDELSPLGLEEKRIVVYKGEEEILAVNSDVRSRIMGLTGLIFTGAAASGGGALIAETVGAIVLYSPVATSGTSFYALYSQYVLANMAASASSAILAVPVLGFTGAIVANAVFGLGVAIVGSKAIQAIYNFFAAKDPVDQIDISAKDLTLELVKSNFGKSSSGK